MSKNYRDPNLLTPKKISTEKEKKEEEALRQDKDTKLIKIHGLQRSATNYVTHLINENFEKVKVLVNFGGWKHGAYCIPYSFDKEIDIVVVVKNPYAWLVSVYNYWSPPKKLNIGPNLEGVSFDQFVRNKAVFEAQKGVPFMYRAANPVQYWNNFNFHWCTIRLSTKKLILISYESLLHDVDSALLEIGKGLDLTPRGSGSKDFKHDFVPAGETIVPAKEKWPNRKFYTEKQYLKIYTPETLDFVNSQLDPDLMKSFGYPYETLESESAK